MGKGQSFQQVVLGNLDLHVQKRRSPYLVPPTKIPSKWKKGLNIRTKAVELLEENTVAQGNIHKILW